MISDIQSMLNASSDKQSNASINSNSALSNVGTIAKLSSEIKLIENLSLIKFQGSEIVNFQGRPAQLLHASSAQQPFTLINTNTPISIADITNAQLNKISQYQANLTISAESLSRLTAPSHSVKLSQTPPGIKQIENVTLASRVVNLTVVSTPASTNMLSNAQTVSSKPMSTASSIVQQPLSHPKENIQATHSPTIQTANTQVINTLQDNTQKADTPSTNNILSKSQLVTVTDGKTEFPILSQTALKKGDIIRVLVDSNNNLQALPPKTNATPTAIVPQLEALKKSLPKQLSFNDMSQLIKQLHTINETSLSTLPSQTQQALKQLIQSLPSLTTLTASPETMKQAIQSSGLFSESLLLNDNKIQLPVDLKLNLERLKNVQESTGVLRLEKALGNHIPTEQIANAIERITTNQLRHMTDQIQIGTPSYPLHIELPIKDGKTHHLTQIEINQDSGTKDDLKRDRRWLVKLKFDFEETGRFHARASIQANKIGIIFAAEDPETVQKLQKNLPALKQQLKDKDIDVERIDTFQSKLDRGDNNNSIKTQSLIDVRT